MSANGVGTPDVPGKRTVTPGEVDATVTRRHGVKIDRTLNRR